MGANPAPTWIYVWFWVGLVPVSLLLGDVYRRLNPLRTVAVLIAEIIGTTERSSRMDRVQYWPAVVGLGMFLVLETVSQEGDWPRVIAGFVSVYAVVNVAAGVWFGPRWFDRCDGFAVYFSLVASLSPFGRSERRAEKGLAGFVLTVLGALVVDGLTRFAFWSPVELVINPSDGNFVQSILLCGVVLVLAVLVMTLLYVGAMRATDRFLKPGSESAVASFAPTLVPMMVGYAIAHYLTAALFESQAGYLLVANRGATNYGFIWNTAIAWMQFAVIMAGALGALFVARRIGQNALRPQFITVGLIPITALTVTYTTIGVAIVAGS